MNRRLLCCLVVTSRNFRARVLEISLFALKKKRHLLRRLRILSQIVPFSLESRQAPARLNIFFTALRNSRLRME